MNFRGRERGREKEGGRYVCVCARTYIYREREREKHVCERETLIGCLLYTPRLGIEPVT